MDYRMACGSIISEVADKNVRSTESAACTLARKVLCRDATDASLILGGLGQVCSI